MTKEEFMKDVRELADVYDEEKDEFREVLEEGREMVEDWHKFDAVLAKKLEGLVLTFARAEAELRDLSMLAKARLEGS